MLMKHVWPEVSLLWWMLVAQVEIGLTLCCVEKALNYRDGVIFGSPPIKYSNSGPEQSIIDDNRYQLID